MGNVGVLLMRPVIGIDPSLTATGIAWPDGTTEVIRWPGSGVHRLAAVYEWGESLSGRGDGLAVIEGYAFSSRNSQAHALGELGGVLRLALHDWAIPFLDVPPACLKKYATGKGNANKDLVRDAARDRLGLPAGVTSDECDAAWLRQIGLALLCDPLAVEVPKVHREALHKIDRTVLGEAA